MQALVRVSFAAFGGVRGNGMPADSGMGDDG